MPSSTRGAPVACTRSATAARRAPRSPSACSLQASSAGRFSRRQAGWSGAGVVHNSTTPRPLAQAVRMVRRSSRSASRAAPTDPRAGASRVFTCPGTGALARMTIRTGGSRGLALQGGHQGNTHQWPIRFAACPRRPTHSKVPPANALHDAAGRSTPRCCRPIHVPVSPANPHQAVVGRSREAPPPCLRLVHRHLAGPAGASCC